MNKAAVLMSVYNGEQYLKEQINSILAQSDVDMDLYIRDDGSKDNSVEIIHDYQNRYKNIFLVKGKNIGVGGSFMQLIYQTAKEYDYYAFADQDDVWLPNKLSAAIEKICVHDQPILYVSNQMLVDKDLEVIDLRYKSQPDFGYRQIICQNKIAGCTMVWNKQLYDLLTDKKRRPSSKLLHKRIHDVWVAMVASVVGKIIYDPESYILYRQHENNVVGVKNSSVIKQWIEKLIDPKKRNGRSTLCQEISEKFSDVIRDRKCLNEIRLYGNYQTDLRAKLLLMKERELISHSGETVLGFRIKVLGNLF